MNERTSCPACGQLMTAENFGSAYVHVCAEGCLGIWVHPDDLKLLDHTKKGAGPALQRALDQT